jgi:hypothetical protein
MSEGVKYGLFLKVWKYALTFSPSFLLKPKIWLVLKLFVVDLKMTT